jgi:hypothetical protein
MARHIEDRIDDLEKSLATMRAKHDRTLPHAVDARLERLEDIVDVLFRTSFNALSREQQQAHRDLKMIRSKKMRRLLEKAKPIKPRRRTRS